MGEVVVLFRTQMYRPDRTITIRSAADGWKSDLGGAYSAGQWRFILTYKPGLEFKFVLDFEFWQRGPNNALQSNQEIAYGDFTLNPVGFEDVAGALPDAEAGILSQVFYKPDLDESKVYDAIVIGSGMGGGILAEALAGKGRRVLVLEAGSFIFPTHVANLPRPHLIGQFEKNVWALWNRPEFRKTTYLNEGIGSAYNGGLGYNVGGRSVFWGGLSPRMREFEFERNAWPTTVRDDVMNYYPAAEDLLKVTPLARTEFQDKCKMVLKNLLGQSYQVSDAPEAVQTETTDFRRISTGLFSTADLLTENQATDQLTGASNLIVNLAHDVRQVLVQGRTATGVRAFDRIARYPRTYSARNIVMAAGTLETAKLAFKSGLADSSGKMANGITDHQIWYVHFGIPDSSPLYSATGSAKILVQHADPTPTQHGWNAVLEIGSDWNQARYVDPDIIAEHSRRRGENSQLCELVFLTASPLGEENYVRPTSDSQDDDGRPMLVHCKLQRRAEVMLPEMDELKRKILGFAKAYPLPGEDGELPLNLAPIGGVAHEAGTMRMSNDPRNGVVDTNLKLHNYENLYCCDLSVFPTSPAANPSLTLAALAIRLADHLAP